MEESGRSDDSLVRTLRQETERVKDLYAQCSEKGIAIEDAWPVVRSAKELIANRRYVLALDLLRDLKIDLLSELLLWDQIPPEHLLPGEAEFVNPLPSEAIAADIESRIVPDANLPPSRDPKPPQTP